MTPDRPFHRDTREDMEGLVHRAQIIRPAVILADGTASSDQVATVPPGVDVGKALMPYRELPGPPSEGYGIAIVGTREPDIGPYLQGSLAATTGDGQNGHITRPQHRDAIMSWLYAITGLRYAPAAFWRVAGWKIAWLANWLDRLRLGGETGHLIIAERQAAAVVRAAWFAWLRNRADNSLSMNTGVLLVARAVIDMLGAFDQVIKEAFCTDPAKAMHQEAVASARAAIAQRLDSCISAIEAASLPRLLSPARHAKIGKALDHARALIDSIGLFSAVGEPISKRVERITDALPTKGREPPPLPVSFNAFLSKAAARLEAVITSPVRQLPDVWTSGAVGDLTRLLDARAPKRLKELERVRTDLVYKLIVTRRLDRLFEALPWMAAPSGAFRLTFGGPLGAVAAMFEVARHREIAIEQVNRTYDPVGGARLDTRYGKHVYSDHQAVRLALKRNSRAAFWLASSALSHHMIEAKLAGRSFAAVHPLPALQAGKLDWDFERAMDDNATLTTVTDTERAKSVYATADYHRDLTRYMGLTVFDVLTVALADIFPQSHRDPGFVKFTIAADARPERLGIELNPFEGDAGAMAFREVLRSILKSIDEPTDGRDDDWRTASVVARSPITTQLHRFDDRNVGHTGDRGDAGGRVLRRAAKLRKALRDPGKKLRHIVDSAWSWTAKSSDQPLISIITGQKRLTVMVPVAQTGISAIWFRPNIDAPIHHWIATGADMWQPIALCNVVQAGLVAGKLRAVVDEMPMLFGMPVAPALLERILVPMWTGLATITEDHAHVR